MAKQQKRPEARFQHLEYHELAQASRDAGCHRLDNQGHDWHGGLDTAEKVQRTLETGSTFMLDESQKMLDRIHDTLDLTGMTRETELSVVGGSPCVAAHLAGSPASMRRTIETEDAGTPVRVFFGLVSSGGINAEDLAIRSAAILAFAQALSLRKPVELVGVCAMRVGWGGDFDTCVTIKIGMAPLDMSAMCALAHPGVQRGALYGMCEKLAGSSSHDNSLLWPETAEAKLAGCQPGDVFFKSPYISDVAEIKKDPIAWVQGQLELALKGDGAAYTGHANDAD